MKDLKHYFNSPTESNKESNKQSQKTPVQNSTDCLNDAKEPAVKKRKISTKGKAEINRSTVKPAQNTDLDSSHEDVFEEVSSQKKRKRNKEKKSKLKKSKTLDDEDPEHIEKKKTEKCKQKSIIKSGILHSESSNSCDGPPVKPKPKRKSKILIDSDEEVAVEEQPADETENKQTNDEKTVNPSRNSLFGYFNKVDKETSLKQKAEKIKVEAIVHVSDQGQKIVRKSLDKFPPVSKSVMKKNKILLDNSDTIEVLSSEEIVDENSSNGANVQISPKPVICVGTLSEPKIHTPPKESTLNTENKPKNLASIFVQKKKEKQELLTPEETVEIVDEAKTPVSVSKNSKKGIEKTPKTSEKKAKSKDDLKKKTKTSKPQKGSESSNSEDLSKNIEKSLVNHKIKSPNSEIPEEEKQFETLVTPERKGETTKDKDGKKQTKHSTLNGYFASNKQKSTPELKHSPKESSKSSPGWVMKVRFGATKPLPDSEEDSKDSSIGVRSSVVDENIKETVEGEAENKSDDESSVDVVVINEDEDTPSERKPNVEKNKVVSKKLEFSNNKRPRRSCTENRKSWAYLNDEDSSDSPKKATESKKSDNKIKEVKEAPSPVDKKKTVDSPKPAVKMWPFFTKGHKPKEAPVDEAKLKAKQLFLESGIPEVIKRKVDSSKSDTAQGVAAPFPTTSHVTQREEKEVGSDLPPLCPRLPRLRPCSPPPTMPRWSSVASIQQTEEKEIPVYKRATNVKTFLNQLKEEEPKTDVKVVYKRLKEYKNGAESDIWTEVYKPNKAADMVGNSDCIKKLKSWLEALKNGRKQEDCMSSGDEFVSDESNEEGASVNNIAVICGPWGCGKTSAVYAVANELDCKVLEINASCNRSGKKILAEFSESTQSHQVERSQTASGLFNNQLSGKARKRKKSRLTNEPKSEKTSLILVEDADLLFADVDEGFMSSLSSLAAATKRPLILVTNQPRTPHLDRFNNSRLLKLTFSRPKPAKLGLWLRLVGLVEGVMMTAAEAQRLISWAQCDVRKCLLQLQLMVHTNNSEIKEELRGAELWWRWPAKHQLSYELPCLLEPENNTEQTTLDKQLVARQLQSIVQTTRQLAYVDLLSPYCQQNDCSADEPCPVAWRTCARDSTMLTERREHSRYHHSAQNTSQDLAAWLSHTVVEETMNSERTGLTASEARWQSILRQGEEHYMAGVSLSHHTNHRAVACDYLPTLRELGRSEQSRLENYTRRANRFFHYLQGLNIHASKSFRDFMSDVFS